jgi:hypothetical protein
MELAPFYVGQKVVSLYDSLYKDTPIKKGQIFSILGIKKGCCKFTGWLVDVGFENIYLITLQCPSCFHSELSKTRWVCSTCFSPINESFQKVTYEKVLEKESELICVN